MKLSSALFGIVCAAYVLPGVSAEPASVGDASQGQSIATKVCAACHAADGNSASPDFPKLAGQHPDYIIKSLQGYKSGTRKNPIMAPMGTNLTQRDMEDLAAYFSQQQGLVTFK